MIIEDLRESNKRIEEHERKIPTYERVVSLADKVFGRDAVSAGNREFVNHIDSIYVGQYTREGPIRCKVMIELKIGERTEVTVYDESYFKNAKRFAEQYEKQFDKFYGEYGNEVRLKHNLQ